MKLKNIIPNHAEEESLDLNGFFKKPKVDKVNVSHVHDEKLDSGDDFKIPTVRKSKKLKSSGHKERSSVHYVVGDVNPMLRKKIDDLEKRFNEEISSLRIFIEERFFVLEGKLDKIHQHKFSSISSNVDKKDAFGSDSKNDKDGVG